MTVKEREEGDVVVLELSGKIMGGPDASLLKQKLDDLLDKGRTKVVADMSKVKWMNSSGLGILISGLATMRNKNGNLKLSNVTDKIHSLLMITKLLTVFDTFESTEEAIASFK